MLKLAGLTLEETAAIFDENEQHHDLVAMGREVAVTSRGMHQNQDIELARTTRSMEAYPKHYDPKHYEHQNCQHYFSDDGSSAILPPDY